MELFCEEDLLTYVEYWGGDLATLEDHPRKRGRGLAAVVFYCLHHPDKWPEKYSWERTIKQAVSFLWGWLHSDWAPEETARIFRTSECKAYFKKLLDGYVALYGEIEVFRYRYQNWAVVDCTTMVDELWTVLEKMK